MAETLLIVGGGGHAREIIALANACSVRWRVVGCVDDDPSLRGRTADGVPVLGPIDEWERHVGNGSLVVAIGSPRLRREIVERLGPSARFATLIHPSVICAGDIDVGSGTMIAPGCVLSIGLRIGRHCIVNLGCTVSHDASLGDFATLAPGLTVPGDVKIGAGAEIAPGASLQRGTEIGRGAFVGLGAAVTRNVPANMLTYGVPARPVRALPEF